MHSRRPIIVLAVGCLCFAACVEQEPEQPSEEDHKYIKQHVLKAAPKMKHVVNADLEGKVTYLGLDVDRDTIKPGVQFQLTHYWKVVKPVAGWRVFVHLGDDSYVNADHKPVGGRYAATFWKAGEIIRDQHKVTLPANWKSATAKVYTGLWRGRLRMKPKGPQDEQNRVIAATLKVDRAATKPAVPLKRLVAVRASKPPTLDGKLDDAVWKTAVSSGPFVDTMTGRPALIKTEAKVAWDDRFLYFAFDNADDDIWSDFKKRDDKLWTQEAVEVFIDANGDGKDYVELQVNPNGAIFDSYLASYRKNNNAWNSKLRAKVRVEGTLKRGDQDKRWTVEIAIPWADVKGEGKYAMTLPPKVGHKWRINLFRTDKPKKGPQRFAGWSPPLVSDFHKLDRFGELVFADKDGKAEGPKNAVVAPQIRRLGRPPGATIPRGVPMAPSGQIRTVADRQPRTVFQKNRGPGTAPSPTPAKTAQ